MRPVDPNHMLWLLQSFRAALIRLITSDEFSPEAVADFRKALAHVDVKIRDRAPWTLATWTREEGDDVSYHGTHYDALRAAALRLGISDDESVYVDDMNEDEIEDWLRDHCSLTGDRYAISNS